MTDSRKIGEILVALKVMKPADVTRVLDAVRRRPRPQKFGQMAKDMGLVREEHILAALAVQMQLLAGISRMTLRQILDALQGAPAPA